MQARVRWRTVSSSVMLPTFIVVLLCSVPALPLPGGAHLSLYHEAISTRAPRSVTVPAPFSAPAVPRAPTHPATREVLAARFGRLRVVHPAPRPRRATVSTAPEPCLQRPGQKCVGQGAVPVYASILTARSRSGYAAQDVPASRPARAARVVSVSAAAFALPVPPVLARAAYLYDVTDGRDLYSRNADVPQAMASTTKIMTALLAIKYGRLDDWVTADTAAATIGQSTMYLQRGERLRLRDLLYGLMLPSGNDAAIAIAEHVGGSVGAFVALMNREARALGMTHTYFVTPHGLDARGHYSSARDMARLAMAAMQYPLFRQVVATRYYTIQATAHNQQHNLININQPLWWYPGTIGVKPGTTGWAGRCAVEWVVRGHRVLLLVLLGDVNLVTDVRDLLNWGFGDFTHWYSPLLAPVVYAPEYFGWDGPGLWVPLADGGRYYVRTGHTVQPPLLTRYLRGGGTSRYGAPVSEAYVSGGLWCQRFTASWLFYNGHNGKSAPYAQEVR